MQNKIHSWDTDFVDLVVNDSLKVDISKHFMTSAPLVNGGNDYSFVFNATTPGAMALADKATNTSVGITKDSEPSLINCDGIEDWGVVLLSLDFGGGNIYFTVYFKNADFVGGTNPSPGTADFDYFDTWMYSLIGILPTCDYFRKSIWIAGSSPTDNYTWANPDSKVVVTGFTTPPTLNFIYNVPTFYVDKTDGITIVRSLQEQYPTLLQLDQNKNNQEMNFPSGTNGLIKAVNGLLDVDTTSYISSIAGQDLATADNSTSQFISSETDPVFSAWLIATPPLFSDPYWKTVTIGMIPTVAPLLDTHSISVNDAGRIFANRIDNGNLHIKDINAVWQLRRSDTTSIIHVDSATGYVGIGLGFTAPNAMFQVENYINFGLNNDTNTFIGKYAGHQANALSQDNTFIGRGAGYSSVSTTVDSIKNVGVGSMALFSLVSGGGNCAIGYGALKYCTDGYGNMAMGSSALEKTTVGNYNYACGTFALQENIDGSHNTAIGNQCMGYNPHGTGDTGIGLQVLLDLNYSTLTTSYNTAIGFNTGRGIVTGINDTIIGANISNLSSTLSNNIILADGGGAIRYQADHNGKVTFTFRDRLHVAFETLEMESVAYNLSGMGLGTEYIPTITPSLNATFSSSPMFVNGSFAVLSIDSTNNNSLALVHYDTSLNIFSIADFRLDPTGPTILASTDLSLYDGSDYHNMDALSYSASGTSPVADGTYTVGAKLTPVTGSDGTITVKGGIITAISSAT